MDVLVSLARNELSLARSKLAADQRWNSEWRSGTDTPTLNGDVIRNFYATHILFLADGGISKASLDHRGKV